MSLSDLIRRAVLRVHDAADPTGLLGTAFVIAPGRALTCAHVIEDCRGQLALADSRGSWPVKGLPDVAPDPAVNDLALLPVDPSFPALLSCAGAAETPDHLLARGYSPTAMSPGGRELKFASRGHFDAIYHTDVRTYRTGDAYELSGDLAEKGFSGSPLIDIKSAAVVGVLAAGDRDRGRTWAIPLAAAACNWPALSGALSWNSANLPRFGKMLNLCGANMLCRAQSAGSLARMKAAGRFNPAQNVARQQALQQIETFRGSRASVMAVVGDTGIGKTWLACDLEGRSSMAPFLLLEASDIPRDEPPSLPQLLANALGTAWSNKGESCYAGSMVPDTETLARVVAEGNAPLLVAIDGLNEALDVRQFLRRWLPDAIGWSCTNHVKLLVTTRPKSWRDIIGAIPNAKDVVYDARTKNAAANGDPPAECVPSERPFRLSTFSTVEEREAQRAYGIHLDLPYILRGNPLLYSVAAELNLTHKASALSIYRLIEDFVTKRLGDAVGQLGLRSSELLRDCLQRLASALPENGSGLLDLPTARAIAGDDRTLDSLIDCGLLSRNVNGVRFYYDVLGEILAPAPSDPTTLFAEAGGEDSGTIRRWTYGLLRIESDGNEPGFAMAVTQLVDQINDVANAKICVTTKYRELQLDSTQVLELSTDDYGVVSTHERDSDQARKELVLAALDIVLALPLTRASQIDALLAALCDLMAALNRWDILGLVVGSIESAPLSAGRRAQLLLSIAPCGNSWPFRMKDWKDAGRRPDFERVVEGKDFRGRQIPFEVERHTGLGRLSVPAALNRLHVGARDSVRPVLIGALADSRDLKDHDGATVATLAGGLLFHRRQDDFPGLLDGLFASAERAEHAGFLIAALARTMPLETFAHARTRLGDASRLTGALFALFNTYGQVPQERQQEIIPDLVTVINTNERLSLGAAMALRSIDPPNLLAWDRIAASVAKHERPCTLLSPVPPGRFEQALEIAAGQLEGGPNLFEPLRGGGGYQWMECNDGPENEEAAMAAVASRAFASGLTDGIGTLVEHKLDKFAERGGERFRPWVGVARALVIDTGTRARRPLVYALFADSRYLRRPELSALADLFLQGKPNEPELALLIKVLLGEVWSYETESLAQFGKLRAGQAKLVDRVAFRYGRDNDRLLKYWQSLAPSDHTPISEAVTRLVQDGVALKDITLEQIEQEPRPATVGDCGQNPEVTEQVGLKPVPARTSLATGAGQIFVRLAKAMGHVLNRDRTRHANDRD